ncbi:MAG: hypothetical protein J6A04_07630 [Clostridia bacterium]|nr:hypothetical protein [Clostridia bacterium]
MNNKENNIKKVCAFYVNDWHFTTMILPYIANEIKSKNKIITILQNNMKSNIEEILSKMNLNQKLKEEILEINWTKNFPIKYSNIKQEIQQIDGQVKDINIFINGDKEFIKMVNQNIEKLIEKFNLRTSITIVNFYDITKFTNVSEITDEHQYILNTSGIKKIKEVFQKEA